MPHGNSNILSRGREGREFTDSHSKPCPVSSVKGSEQESGILGDVSTQATEHSLSFGMEVPDIGAKVVLSCEMCVMIYSILDLTPFLLAFKHWPFLASRKAAQMSYRQWCSLTLPNSFWTCWVPDVRHPSAQFLKGDAVSIITYCYSATCLLTIRLILLFLNGKIFIRLIWEFNSIIKDSSVWLIHQ